VRRVFGTWLTAYEGVYVCDGRIDSAYTATPLTTEHPVTMSATRGKKLAFAESIVSSAAEPISAKDLLARLTALHKELSKLNQSDVDLISLETVKEQLESKKLLRNTHKGIQAYTACCLADILRLYAPDAPYDDSTLLNIFKLFLQQFSNLDDPDSSLYPQYVYLLERVAEVKLIALLTDLNNSDKLIAQLFECFYGLASNRYFDLESLQPLLIDILSEVIVEVNQLDLKILKLILNKFLANSKNMKNQSTIKVPGFELSLSLCETNSDKLSRLITYFFSEMILEATNAPMSDIDENSEEETNRNNDAESSIDVVQMKKVHLLSIELWRYVPEMLTSVLGLLDNELEADNPTVRSIATETVSKILAIQPSRINFPTTYVETYMHWLKKPLDVSIDIRLSWIHGLAEILEKRTDIISDLANGLLKTMIDSNDKIRYHTILELGKLKPETFLNKILNDSISDTLLKLLREKNATIRKEINSFLSVLYNHSFSLPSLHSSSANFVAKIPSSIISMIFINDTTINAEVDLALFEKLLPFNSDPDDRVERLITFLASLTPQTQSAFFAIIKRQSQLSQVVLRILSLEEDDYDDRESISSAINWLSKLFPTTYNADVSLNQFFSLKNKRLNRLLSLCATNNTDYDTIVSSMKEILNRLKEPKFYDNGHNEEFNASEIFDTIQLLLLRCSNILCNMRNISSLVDISSDKANALHEPAKLLLNEISKQHSGLLESNILILMNKIVIKTREIDFDSARSDNDMAKDLKIIRNYFQGNDTDIQPSKEFLNTLTRMCTRGSPLEAKYATKIINVSAGFRKDSIYGDIVSHIWPLELDSMFINTHLSTLSTLFLCDFTSVEHIKEDLSKILASEILLKNTIKEEDEENKGSPDGANVEAEAEVTWIDDGALLYGANNSNCLSKILTMKLLTNWLLAVRNDPTVDRDSISKPILSMLSSFINRGGEITSTGNTSPSFCSRLRLHAGIQLLKISQYSEYDSFIDQRRINRLILLIQDVEMEVRLRFLVKLKKRLSQNQISKRFLSLIFFVAHEPNAEIRNSTVTWIRASFSKQTTTSSAESLVFEKSYVRMLSMIFNHPEYRELYNAYSATLSTGDDVAVSEEGDSSFKQLLSFALTYMVFALHSIINSENISLLYYLSQRIKQYKPTTIVPGVEQSKNGLYLLSELSQATIKYIGSLKNWSIPVWPGKLNLPHDLFERIDMDEANTNIRTNFLDEKDNTVVDEIIRNRWRIEQGIISRKPKRKAREIFIEEEQSDNEQPNKQKSSKKKLTAKSRRKKATKNKNQDSSRTNESDEEYNAPNDKENIANARRTSRRLKRVNYQESF
jgi:sister-chromatid-cohesion protein PDS5